MKKRKGEKLWPETEAETGLPSGLPLSSVGDPSPSLGDSSAETNAAAAVILEAPVDVAFNVVDDDDITNRVVLTAGTTATDGDTGIDATSNATHDAPPDTTPDAPSDTNDGAVVDGAPAEAQHTPPVEGPQLESILESLLFAADRPLTLSDLKRLLGERDGKRVTAALEALRARHDQSGIQLVSVAGGWQLRTHPANGAWVAKLVAGRPPRLSRAMMETLSIVAYRQPITRPEIDEIRGVDCGPVLRTLLDRSFIRVIGKKEEVGRPILYGTTPEFLKTFSLRDLTELPSLREFHELGADDRAKVDATGSDVAGGQGVPDVVDGGPGDARAGRPTPGSLSTADPEEEDSLLGELDRAAIAAADASRSFADRDANPEAAPGASDAGER